MRNALEPTLIAPLTRPFAALSPPEARALRRWLLTAREAGIDDARDLTSRRWPLGFSGAVIGIFTAGSDQAAWLAVGRNGHWAVARCADGSVLGPFDSLTEALALVYRAGEPSGCR